MHDLSYIVKANREEAARQLKIEQERTRKARERIERANAGKARVLKQSRGK